MCVMLVTVVSVARTINHSAQGLIFFWSVGEFSSAFVVNGYPLVGVAWDSLINPTKRNRITHKSSGTKRHPSATQPPPFFALSRLGEPSGTKSHIPRANY